MKKISISVSIILILLSIGCNSRDYEIIKNNKPKYGVKKAEIKDIYKIDEFLTANTSNCLGLYDNHIYYMSYLPSKNMYMLNFIDMNGNIKNKIPVEIGKGPGEIVHTGGIKIDNEKIYILDLKLRRLTYFTIEGMLIDTLDLKDTGLILNFDINDNVLSFYSRNKYFLGRYNIEKNKIISSIQRKTTPKDGDRYKGGTVKIDDDTNKLYYGHLSIPYSIDSLNENLKTNRRINIDYDSFDRVIWRIKDKNHKSMYGDFMINSMDITDNYIYAPVMTKSKLFKGKNSKLKKVNGKITVFNKKTGNLWYIIENEYLKDLNGMYSMIGVNKDYIVLYIFSRKGSKIYNKLVETKDKSYIRAIVVLKNPINYKETKL
ncbi:MAG: hypothetical protein FXF47_05070 [Candidatus Mcinerneyibacterium aminivorans]|uniref:6-bladed beta-propeller n=1 Tax=Candidatus Mcinerneyibacterium aminivorans TaxID=2703815 RepID=A0A5D0ML45_9BACT|nr:MAG: hypothetical protein FXF47_05070 [Candidatus Mcinerneyibacterium aminivorans]